MGLLKKIITGLCVKGMNSERTNFTALITQIGLIITA